MLRSPTERVNPQSPARRYGVHYTGQRSRIRGRIPKATRTRLSGRTAGLNGAAPSMQFNPLRDGVQDYGYFQILKNRGHGGWALEQSRKVAPDWTHRRGSYALLESVRVNVGNQIEAFGCSR
jgi:hypothetical protein